MGDEQKRSNVDKTCGVTKYKAKHSMSKSFSRPCGVCKHQRKKCPNDCVFAPYFGSDQGLAQFTKVHKVFGAKNVLKMLMNVEVSRRQEMMRSILFEAQARSIHPVKGCISIMTHLQHQVASLQEQIAMVKNLQTTTKILYEGLVGFEQQPEPNMNIAAVQPPFSNNLSASTSFMNMNMNMNNFNFSSDNLGMQTTPLMQNLEPLQSEDENMILQSFNNGMPHLFP